MPDFEILFDALPSPYMLLDGRWNYVAVNAAYEAAVMRPRSELIGRHLFDLFPNDGESGRRLRESFERVFATGETDTIAYIPYDIPRPPEKGGGTETRFWTAVHTPVTKADGTTEFLIQNTVDVTEMVRLREAAHLPFRLNETRLLERAREAEEQHQSILAESEDFRRLFQQAPGFFAVLSGPDHVFTFANDAYIRLIGDREVIGKALADALPEIEDQGFIDMLDKVYKTGEPVTGEAMRVMLRRSPDQPMHESFLDFSYDAIRDRDGRIAGVFMQGMDRTESVRHQRHQRLLLDELNHRVKNTLATVQSLTSMTLRSADDLDGARASIEARLIALSKAHNLLSDQTWTNADLREIARQELRPFDDRRVMLKGGRVDVRPQTAIMLALVLHELCTNAAKFGALSASEGTVGVGWEISPEDSSLHLTWQENGGPAANEPRKPGFGTRMIRQAVTGEMGGDIKMTFDETGFRSEIDIPADAWRTDIEHAATH